MKADGPSIRRPLMRRWPRSNVCQVVISTSSTITCSATAASRRRFRWHARHGTPVASRWDCERRTAPDLLERAVDAGLRSLFVGFETLNPANRRAVEVAANLRYDYARDSPSHDLGVMINGSFV